MNIYFIILLSALLLCPSISPAAELYMWVDDRGIRQITDQPPEKPAKMIGKDSYKKDSPEEIQRYEQQQKLKQYQSELEAERQKRINRINEAGDNSRDSRKQDQKDSEVKRANESLAFAEKYQKKYEDNRRNAKYQWEIDMYDDLKKQQDKEVDAARHKLQDATNR